MDSKYLTNNLNKQGEMIPPEMYVVFKNTSRMYVNDLVNKAVVNTKGKIFLLNDDAYGVLKLCTGDNSISDIFQKINCKRNKPLEIHEENKICSFINHMSENEILEIVKKPIYSNTIQIYDNNDFYPFRVSLELSKKCNLKCSFCYANCDSENSLFMENPIEVLQNLKEHGTEVVEITGGEPFLHKDIMDLLEFSVNTFFHVSLLTNGTLLNKEIIDFIEKYNDKITLQIDIHTLNSERYRDITGMNLLGIVLKNIEMINKTNIVYRVVTVVIDELSINELENIANFALINKAKSYALSPVIKVGRGSIFNNSETFYKNFWEKVIYLYGKYGKFIRLVEEENKPIHNEKMNLKNCGLGFITMVIDPNKKLRPCAFFKQYKSFDRLDDIEYRKLFSKIPAPNKIDCGNCPNIDGCNNCIYNGFVKYQEIKEKCSWGEKYKLNEIIYD